MMRRASQTTGFGFTVTGSCPVRVGRVASPSPASEAGMRRGDLIERVDKINVSRSASDSVAALVRSVLSSSLVVLVQCSPKWATSFHDRGSYEYDQIRVSLLSV